MPAGIKIACLARFNISINESIFEVQGSRFKVQGSKIRAKD
jgi:hypothetical protein